MLNTRAFLATLGRGLLAGFALSAVVLPASAQAFPERPVRIITPFPVGSGPDAMLRIAAEKLGATWGQSVIVENRPGANGFIAIDAVKRAAPDGLTLLQLDNAQMAAQPHLFQKLPYHLQNDFEPVASLFQNAFFIAVPQNSSIQSVTDLVAAARQQPGRLNYGSWFIGSPGHLGAAMLENATDITMTHVPYKEMSQLYGSVSNAEIDWAFGSAASAGPLQRAGKLRFIAVASPRRDASYPDIPTVAEAGGPDGFALEAWTGLFAPKGTPASAIAVLQDGVRKVLADPDMRQRLAGLSYEPLDLTAAAFQERVHSDGVQFGEAVRRLDISLD